MKPRLPVQPLLLWITFLLVTSTSTVRADSRFVGRWLLDEGFQTVELLFRSDGRYRIDTRSTDPVLDFNFTELGRYVVAGNTVSLESYEYFGSPELRPYEFQFEGESLALTRTEFSLTVVYQYQAGSRSQVLANEGAEENVIGRWRRTDASSGTDEYTFRPGGYYVLVRTHPNSQFPPEIIRGRYALENSELTLQPYSGVSARLELDFFGSTLTVIRHEEFSGDATEYELVAGSRAEVQAKAAEAAAFLASEGWQTGVWEIRDPFLKVDLTLRPDGHYTAVNLSDSFPGIVRGRYTLPPHRLQLLPFVGQDPYSRSTGEFGKFEQTRELDYYDGELQIIHLEAISQSVALGRKRPGSDAAVLAKVQQSQTERQRDGWHIGTWEVNDPLGWMQFTFRPDGRYWIQSGTGGIPSQVERGQYALSAEKITLAPYVGQGAARGFEIDLFDGDFYLVGDGARMVIARKLNGSEADVIRKSTDPEALKGERGGLLGRWSAPLPGQSSELVFRDDGQFRLDRCSQNTESRDYGLYQVNLANRTVMLDSRFSPVTTAGLDFYDDTLTLYGEGLGAPRTYVVNLGKVDASIAASFAADAAREQIDADWLARVPVAPRDLTAVYVPTGDLPADPFPDRRYPDPTVFTQYQLYRRLIPGFVYFNVQGVIKSVAVVHTREWHFFPTGRVYVRFKNYYAGPIYPSTLLEVSDYWGAYTVGAKPEETDILHLFADNALWTSMDIGEEAEMTLEDGRRHLFWGKDYLLLSEWASEQKPISCESPAVTDLRVMNTGVSLTTSIPPDDVGTAVPVLHSLDRTPGGELIFRGSLEGAGKVVLEMSTSLAGTPQWLPVRTNQVPSGAFTLTNSIPAESQGFFRLRRP